MGIPSCSEPTRHPTARISGTGPSRMGSPAARVTRRTAEIPVTVEPGRIRGLVGRGLRSRLVEALRSIGWGKGNPEECRVLARRLSVPETGRCATAATWTWRSGHPAAQHLDVRRRPVVQPPGQSGQFDADLWRSTLQPQRRHPPQRAVLSHHVGDVQLRCQDRLHPARRRTVAGSTTRTTGTCRTTVTA